MNHDNTPIGISIRPLQEEDAQAVAQLWVNGLQQTRDAVQECWIVKRLCLQRLMDQLEVTATSEDGHVGPNGSKLYAFWTSHDRQMFVAEWRHDDDNRMEIVGCIGIKQGQTENRVEPDSPCASVWMMSVQESCRRNGVGTKLMHHAEQWAIQKPLCSSYMHLVTGNPVARQFYHKLGYRDNHWLIPTMEKKLCLLSETGKEVKD